MLVLSRRLKERVLIPSAGAAIQVLALTPAVARLGITAPPDVEILREEIAFGAGDGPAPRAAAHAVRNGLNNLSLGLALLRAQLASSPPGALATLLRVEAEYAALCRELLPAPAAAGTVGG